MNNQEKCKATMFSELAQLTKGMANSGRLKILHYLTQSPKTVDEIAKATGMNIANTSRHLKVLKDSHLVKFRKEKNYVIYSLANYKIANLINDLIDVTEDEDVEFRKAQNLANSEAGVKTISLAEAKRIVSDSLLLDVRPTDEYQHGHIRDAVNIAFTEIDQQMQNLPLDKPIIVYCRGQLCAITNQVTQKLNAAGFEAYSLNQSYYDWKSNLK